MARTTTARRWLLASLACGALVAAACTDGDDGSSSATTITAAQGEAATPALVDVGRVGGGALVEEVLTPVLGWAETAPSPVLGTDGEVILAYELVLLNATSAPATVTSVEVLDADAGEPLQEISGEDLVGHTMVVGQRPTTPPPAVEIAPGSVAIVWLDPSVAEGAEVPANLVHEVTVTFADPPPLVEPSSTETIAPVEVSTVPPAVIDPPLDGDGWFDGNGCCDEVTPHRGAANPINGNYYLAERFAIDWVQLDDQMRMVDGDPTQLSSYAFYDAPIYAVADGTIEVVFDELPDETPGANPPAGSLEITEFGGNHVVQSFEQNGITYYAFYAHLAPGSASESVQVGQQVKAGDQIGRLGNSGNTDAPHLHFHVMDSPNPLGSDGLPYVFRSMDLVGRATDTDAFVAALTEGTPLPLRQGGPTGTRTDQMPLYLDVVDLRRAGA